MHIPIMIIFLLISSASLAKKKVLRIGYFVSPPNIICEGPCKKPKGAVVDLLEDTFSKGEYKLEWHKFPFLRLLQSLKVGEIDAIAMLGKTAEREKVFTYPNLAFHQIHAALGIHKEVNLNKIRSAQDIKGWSLSYTSKGLVPNFLKKAEVTWEHIRGIDYLMSGIRMVCLNRVNAVYYPVKESLDYLQKNQSTASCLKVLKLPTPAESLFTLFSKSSPKKLIQFYEYRTRNILKNKKYSDYIKHYLK